jgi:hypothetical protein
VLSVNPVVSEPRRISFLMLRFEMLRFAQHDSFIKTLLSLNPFIYLFFTGG